MEMLQFSNESYQTRFGEVLDISGLTEPEKACLREAIDLHNKNIRCIDFVEWLWQQPKIMRYFVIANKGIRITEAGKRSPLYRACDDIALRLAREQRLIGLRKN